MVYTCFHTGVPGDEMISKEVLVQPGGLLCFGKRRPYNVGRGYLRKKSILRWIMMSLCTFNWEARIVLIMT
jgi:hypothetical protein